MSRWKAAAIHLSISIAIGILSAALIFGLWYPPPYSHAAGADKLVLLLLGVDVALGPLLTLVVFKAGKKSLRFDLSLIALLQTCAFLYGTSIVVRARPAFIVGAADRFMLVSASDLDAKDLAEGRKQEFRSIPWTGPLLVGVHMPTDAKERNELMLSGAAGKDIEKFPKYYVDYTSAEIELLKRSRPLSDLRAKHPESNPLIDAWLNSHQKRADDIVWLPLTAARADLTMLLDASTGLILGALSIDPW